MIVEKDVVVTATYSLSVDGEHVETADETQPLVFLAGHGSMIPGFENQLLGKAAGDEYAIEVAPADGYGVFEQEAIIDVPRNIFAVDGKEVDELEKGATMNLQDQAGNPLKGVVLEIEDETVKLDFNHPLAGKTLKFSGKIMELRKAEEEELAHGHVHGPNGHQH